MSRRLAGIAPVMLAGCATAPAASDPAADPRGYWTIAAVNGEATGGGEQFRFIITPPVGSAQFGCNAGGGSLTAQDGWVVAGGWIMTVAGCRSERIARLERRGFEITTRPMTVERRNGGIRLRSERGTIDLAPRDFPSIIGRWHVTAVHGQPVSGTADIRASLSSVSFGCNDLRGAYRQKGEKLMTVGPMATTERGCMDADGSPANVMQREEEGFRIMTRAMHITFYGSDRIQLSNEAGTIELSR